MSGYYLKHYLIMKKNYALVLLSAAALTANAQQINGDFDSEWEDCIPWNSENNESKRGTQPQGWHMANVPASAINVGEKVTRSTEDEYVNSAVRLKNINMMGQYIPGYISLGTPWATAETKGLINMSIRNSDGGVFGGKEFAYHPDAVSFEYQRDNSNGKDEQATVVAYLWNGTWTQKDVPGNTAVGVVSFGTATKVDMVNRDRNILGMTPTATGGEVSKTDGATLVANLEYPITEATAEGEWKTATVPFVYTEGNEEAKVENINVIFSATNYFGDQSGIVPNNTLAIDNVKLVYYHALSDLKATDNYGNDAKLEFDPETYNYTVNSTYSEDWTEVTPVKKGVGATVEAAYDKKTAQYVITVKGEDYDAETNPEAVTTYTIQYEKPVATLSSLNVAGHEFIAAGVESTEFTATGNYYADEVSYKAAEDATVETNYDSKDGKLTVTVGGEGYVENVYTVTFEGKSKDAVYQIPNSDFEAWTDDETPKLSESWNSFDTAAGLFASFAAMSPMPEKIEGYKGNGVRIISKDLWIAYANGNLTTGKINMGNTNPADESNYNFTDRTDVNGNMPFAGRPDAFEVYARFTPGTAKELTDDEKAEGKTQPELQGRVQLILHTDAAYHDPELAEQADDKVGSASVIIPETKEWTKFTGEFNYVNGIPTGTQYMLASATTNPVPGASYDDNLDLDELKLIYFHSLTDLKVKGETIEDFSPEKTEYTVKGNLLDILGDVTYDVKGVGASAVVNSDVEKNEMTISVLGNDYAVNKESITTYTIKFETESSISSISASEATNHEVYTLGGVRVNGKPVAGVYVVDGKKMYVK